MLRLKLGRAKSGKTAAVMREIEARVDARQGETVLLVPEQYSHEAETELLRVCGDSLSLYAEVLSFTRLASRVEAELGLGGRKYLDQGGRLLCLARALDAAGSRLKVFGAARRQAPAQLSLLGAIDECKTGRVAAETLRGVPAEEGLREKLDDLALILDAYEAVAAQSGLDPLDRLTLLAERIGDSACAGGAFYIDGFTDFTAQERAVIGALLRGGAEVTVCLTCAGLAEGHEIFEPSRRAAVGLRDMAEDLGVPCEITLSADEEAASGPMAFLERELFSFRGAVCDAGGSVGLLRAASVPEECAHAAARCRRLVRETGCRWRDIAVAARDFEVYRAGLDSAFAHYGVPLYTAKKSDILSKPLPALITGAYAAVTRGWEYDDVFSYLKTGLAGLSLAETDALENYAFLWSLRGSAWAKDEDWTLHPDGFAREFDDDSRERLAQINALRRRAAGPLRLLAARGAEETTGAGQARALADFFDALDLPPLLERRAGELKDLGMAQDAAEYVQLWDIIVNALEQCAAVLGDAEMDAETFGNLFCLVLSAYDVGSIPLSLDKVSAGDMGRMRRRHIKHLIVLGCDSDTLPRAGVSAGVFTDEDREALRAAGVALGDTAEARLSREFALLYNCLTLPSRTLTMSWCAAGKEGASALPAFVVTRAERIFGIKTKPVDPAACRMEAPAPAFELAAGALHPRHRPENAAARRYFAEHGQAEALQKLEAAAKLTRGRLSRGAVRALYGEKLRLSASRADQLASCGFAYFLQYGLKAKPRQAAEFAPPEMGSFMHYVLENVAREISASGGFQKAEEKTIEALCDKYVERYIHEKLWDFRQKSPRFVYLFRRLIKNVRAVVLDMAAELKHSDFQPLDFELNFGDRAAFPPIALGEGDSAMALTGVADRVDGWLHDGKLYLRVVDYKTGKKAFSLSDVWYGMGLQMLLYLFALQRGGKARYGRKIVPAGVLYVPARDVLLSAGAEMTQEEIVAEKAKQLRRSGLLLDAPEVLAAMERGETPRWLPVKFKDGVPAGDVASAERFGALSRHIDDTLKALAKELRGGSIAADPWFRTQTENACRFCDYAGACHFDENDDHIRYMTKLKPAEVWQKLEQEGTT